VSDRVVGLALSGGGSRAAAFHLGCLRALRDRDLLRRVRVVSGVSGGALLTALWAYGPSAFEEFDEATVRLLRLGLHLSIAWRTVLPTSWIRGRTRTDALAATLEDLAFGNKALPNVTHSGTDVILNATDLRTSNAVRFGSVVSSCSRYGTIVEPVTVADAVAASAAFPPLLPAMRRTLTFERDGRRQPQRLVLADGGVYDNLGLSALEPGRSKAFTPHAYDLPYLISCDAGRGELRMRSPRFLLGRLWRSFDVIHRRAQDAGRARLHEWRAAGRIDGFLMAYLGMRDDRLPAPVADLVPRAAVASYPTNFAAMHRDDLQELATRGEQLVRSLLPTYCPELV